MAARPLAVVTGASSGIGRALALRLACGGHDLALVARDHSRLGEVAKQAEALGARAQTIIEDLSKPGAAQRVAARVEGPVELLVNNAGFGMHGEFWRTVLSQEQAMLQIHVGALLELTRALLPGMVSRGRGRVANIGSVYSYAPMPYQAVYGATKAFLLSFSEALNGELSGTGVTVTAVPPGLTRTESQPRRHRGQGRGMSSGGGRRPTAASWPGGASSPGLPNKIFVVAASLRRRAVSRSCAPSIATAPQRDKVANCL